jgi:glucosamine kinase
MSPSRAPNDQNGSSNVIETVVGADLGGTSTRVVVADPGGRVVGRGRAGAGNPVSSPQLAAGSLHAALDEALAAAGRPAVGRVVLGVAGGSALRDGPVAEEFAAALAGAGVHAAPTYLPDLAVAHAAGSARPDGLVLIAGTGASAGVVADHLLVRTAGGHGWLLGDEGAGFWLGREAVRTLLADVDAGRPPGRLAGSALAALVEPADGAPGGEVPHDDPDALRRLVVRAVHARPPVRLADLAPLVVGAADDGDEVALAVVARAGEALAALVTGLPAPDPGGDLVVAGGLLGSGSPVRTALERALDRAPSAPPVRTAGPGELGAAWLALGARPDLRAPLGLG